MKKPGIFSMIGPGKTFAAGKASGANRAGSGRVTNSLPRFSRRGNYNVGIDSRNLVQIRHEGERVRKGDFALARFHIKTSRPFSGKVYLRFHASDTFPGSNERNAGRRLKELLIDGQTAWQADVCGPTPTTPGKRFETVEVGKYLRGKRTVELAFRLRETRSFKPGYPLRVFFGPLSVHPDAKPGPHPSDAPVRLQQLGPDRRPAAARAVRSIPVLLDAPERKLAAPEPVSFGLPLPRGMSNNASGLRLFLGGRELPVQSETLARWPDGSPRRVLLDTILPAGSVLAGSGRINVGGGATRRKGLKVSRSRGRFIINSGTRKWTIEPRTFLETTMVLSVTAAGGVLHRSGAADEAFLERRGPVRATLILGGWLKPARGERFMRYRFSLNFFAGSSALRTELALTSYLKHGRHRMVPNRRGSKGSGDDFMRSPLKGVELSLPMRLSKDALVSFPGTLDGPNVPCEKCPTLAKISALRFTFSGTPTGEPELGYDSGRHTPGAALIEDGSQSVFFLPEHFDERHPKRVRVSPEGLVYSLWPRETHPEPWMFGQGQSASWRFELAWGNEATARAKQAADPDYRRAPPILFAHPEWTAASGALGPLAAWQKALPQTWEEELGKIARGIDERNFTGEEDFGDYGLTWGNQWLVHNNEYDVAHGCFVSFAASGFRPLYDAFRSKALHYRDTDIIHFCPRIPEWYRAALHRQYGFPVLKNRDVVIWEGGAHHHHIGHTYEGASPCHTWLRCLLDYYYQTGDRRTLEIARRVGDYFARVERMAIYRSGSDLGGERWIGWMLIGLSSIYEATADRKYLDAARACAERAMTRAHPVRGGFTYSAFGEKLEGGCTFQAGILCEGLLDYHAITGDPQVAEFVVKLCRWLLDEMNLTGTKDFYYYQGVGAHPLTTICRTWARGLIFAYERTDEKQFLKWALRATGVADNGSVLEDGRLLHGGVHVLFPYELPWSVVRARALEQKEAARPT